MDISWVIVIILALGWYIHYEYLSYKIRNLTFSLRKASSSWYKPEKTAVYRMIFYTRKYLLARRFSKELLNVVREMHIDSRITPHLMRRDLATIIDEYVNDRKLLSHPVHKYEKMLPQYKMEDLIQKEMKIANEYPKDGTTS